MDPPSPAADRAAGGLDERRRQQERLHREEAYYQFINGLSEDEYRLMRDSNLLGTPGEVTAEELRQRLDGAKERLSSQPSVDAGPPAEEDSSNGAGEPAGEASNGDSLLEWLNTFRRTGNATRSGQSGNQTWRAVSRTNPNSGEFRFSLEININHEQPEPAELDPGDAPPASLTAPHPPPRVTQGRRAQAAAARRTRGSLAPPSPDPPAGRTRSLRRSEVPLPPTPAPPRRARTSGGRRGRARLSPRPQTLGAQEPPTDSPATPPCPRVLPEPQLQGEPAPATAPLRSSRTRARGRGGRGGRGGVSHSQAGGRSRSPLRREPGETAPPSPREGEGEGAGETVTAGGVGTLGVAMETEQPAREPGAAPVTAPPPPAPEGAVEEGEAQVAGAAGAGGGSMRRHPTIMLDLQVRRIRPGENRDRDSIASRTRSRVRMAENTVTFESDSGGFRRTISRSERAGIRTYVSTIRIPLRRISETGLGEPSSTALRSILRQIMTGFGELSSLMETEADSEAAAPGLEGGGGPAVQTFRVHANDGPVPRDAVERRGVDGEVGVGLASAAEEDEDDEEEEEGEERRLGGGGNAQLAGQQQGEGRQAHRDTNNLVENGTLPILRLAHFFLLNDEEEEEHPRGLSKEQIDNLSTRTYGLASLEGELGRTCSVCINEYAQGNKLRRLPCAHEFHIHCIDRWLSENNTCPICRQPILQPPHD
ncbi:E3 ubiquitin-protein ligase RNF6 [Amia ocellicauda]|uniref:E3 ubiquitin-protein ligase RNF6 n=1 Tax=Amia ocellicauda TaxID=2972642 RepID=UPI0034647D99